jgi:hypothetical protein
MLNSYLELCIYPSEVFGGQFKTLPGVKLHDKIEENFEISDETFYALRAKLEQSSRKICMMWHAAEEAIKAESEFYSKTIKDAPALFGEDAIKIHFYLEAMVLFARSAMDIASTAFGWTLPNPFPRKRYDSFNKLVKEVVKVPSLRLSSFLQKLREEETSWLSIIAGTERGRSLRDKLAHQTEFPIEYIELTPNSEKRRAVVEIGKNMVPLEDFINSLCVGVVSGFLEIEKYSIKHIENINSHIYAGDEDI